MKVFDVIHHCNNVYPHTLVYLYERGNRVAEYYVDKLDAETLSKEIAGFYVSGIVISFTLKEGDT